MKKTSPKKLHPMAHTHTQTDGHGDSKTNSAKRAELVKTLKMTRLKKTPI